MDDRQLLRQFVDHNSQEAFAALTQRYLCLVYSVCRRELDDAETAEDVTQAVFLILARKAPALRRSVVLSGWLFQTARFAAKNARTQAQRRAAHEQKAVEAMQQQSEREDAAWAEIEPLLNPALAALKEGERQCVLLRFFQGMTFAETGTAIGLSEEAARKRLTRALEKMRKSFEKGGVIVPGAVLAALLSAHAAKAAPAPVAAAVAQLTAGLVPGPISLLVEGVLHAMKIARLKTAAGAAALALLVIAAYPVLTHARGAGAIHPAVIRQGTPPASPTAAPVTAFPKSATLSGRVVYADGRPAAGIQVAAGLQSKAEADLTRRTPESAWGAISAISGMGDTTKPDGSYRFKVAPNLPYDVMVDMTRPGAEDDQAVQWVAAANEGMVGKDNKTTPLPDLVLTRGVFVTGLVTDNASGRPLAGVHIGSHGPHRPFTTGMIIGTDTDQSGHYRLRLAPGKSEVYIADGRYNGFFDAEARAKKLIVPVTTSKGHPATVDFQVTPSPPKP